MTEKAERGCTMVRKFKDIKEGKVKVTPKKKKVKFEMVEKGSLKDKRLDDIVPLMVEVINRLLGAKGMLRYRKDFVNKVKEVMGEEKKGIKGA